MRVVELVRPRQMPLSEVPIGDPFRLGNGLYLKSNMVMADLGERGRGTVVFSTHEGYLMAFDPETEVLHVDAEIVVR